jgi:hypothetical protein
VLESPQPADAMGGRVTVTPQATSSDLQRSERKRFSIGIGNVFRDGGRGAGPPPPAAPPMVERAGRSGGGAGGGGGYDVLGPATSAPVRVRAAPLGECTMDLRGLVDTPAGYYTGTPGAALQEPTAITACLLEATYGELRRHVPTWATTRIHQQTLNLRWQVVWRGEPFETFRERAGFNGLADLWLDEDGAWRYTMHHTAAPVATLTPREILGEVAVGFLAPSATHLTVTWGDGLTRGTFTLETPTMRARYGRIQDRALGLPWIASEAIARTVAAQWLPKWDRDRWTATVAVAPSLTALTRTDRVLIDTPILNPYGLVWEIRGTTDRGDQRVLTLIEGDATGEMLPGFLGGVIRATAIAMGTFGVLSTLGGAGIGMATATGVLTTFGAALLTGPLMGQAMVSGAVMVSVTLVGTLMGPATASGTLTIPVAGPSVITTALGSTPSNGTALATSYTVSITVPSGTNRLLLLIAGMDSSPSAGWTSVSSDLDGALTATGMDQENTSDLQRLAIWAKVNPTVGTHTMTVTQMASTRGRAIALVLSNVHQTTPYGAAIENQQAATAAATLTMTGAAADKLSLGVMAFDTGTYAERDLVPTGGATEVAEWGTPTSSAGHISVIALLGATTLGWTWTGNVRWIAGGHVINAA